jgi:maltooligosyltrehalose trehalohydrolase
VITSAVVHTSQHQMPFGATPQSAGGVRFNLWAPRFERIGLWLEGSESLLPMRASADGWHTLISAQAQAGSRYRFVLPDGQQVPDPASRFQPDDVHGPSEVIDPAAYHWHDRNWHGRAWHESVIYELHVGSFTGAGTFRGAIERLQYLRELGVNTLELMPVGDFPGRRDWGYDGTLVYAPDSSYGRPEDLKALVDAAHACALSVILDVVYNHFGPDGNYLSLYAPRFFNARHQTPWGAAINFDAEGSRTVREYFVHNALYWLEEFHFDGLRLDAIHAIADDSEPHIVQELAQRLRAEALPRQLHLVVENEHNQTRWLRRAQPGSAVLYDAQWNDDVHHVLHAAASGEGEGYYAEYLGDTEKLGRALAQGFAFQGEHMAYRDGTRGEPCAHLPPCAFIAFIQNHDQVGNRAFGERLSSIAPAAAVRAVTALYLLLPQIPMLFMGEEWHSRQPFAFFCDFDGPLAQAVRAGRRQEFARFTAFRDEHARARIPDPQAEQTFLDSKLDWHRLAEPAHAATWRFYHDLLAVRRQHIAPLIPTLTQAAHYRIISPGALLVQWRNPAPLAAPLALTLLANLNACSTAGFPDAPGTLLWQEGSMDPAGALGLWSVRWTLRGGAADQRERRA